MLAIAVAGQKGGGSKSTLSIHLAGAAASAGQKVALLDADPQQSSFTWGAIRKEAGLGLPDVRKLDADHVARDLAACKAAGYEVVIIDTAPHADTALTFIARAVDIIVAPLCPWGIELAAYPAVVRIIQASGRPGIAVLSRVPTRAPEEVEGRLVLESYGLPVAPAVIYERRSIPRSYGAGQTIAEFDPTSPSVDEFAALYTWIREQSK